MIETVTFRGPQVCALLGISYRQLDYWTRTGRLRPAVPARGSGTQRRFDLRDTQVAWVLGQLGALAVGGAGGLPDVGCLYGLRSWDGWFVVAPAGQARYVIDPDELALFPVAVVIDLASCPLRVDVEEARSS